jgi:hypothetical protein
MPSPRTWTSYEQSSPAVAGRSGEHHAEHPLACRTKSPHDERRRILELSDPANSVHGYRHGVTKA